LPAISPLLTAREFGEHRLDAAFDQSRLLLLLVAFVAVAIDQVEHRARPALLLLAGALGDAHLDRDLADLQRHHAACGKFWRWKNW
jgi:hypothetical protein